ncbi:tRNA 2'-phosphotransferase 1 isoform X2 [Folsomia candida]|uniref:tRNA 2'-phosphotransferase 1 isoform X2 n=1 Tax=Folsomia candida TaxID=158441 RepID=UPI000B8F2C23|nr:tRNA 2'-phosphotransferase 1 isoform X2 [Folsomia candida]
MASSATNKPYRPRNPRGHPHRTDPRGSNDPSSTIALSKALSWLLRHNAVQEGLHIESGGWVDLSAVLKLPRFTNWTVDDVKAVVASNDKQRFSLRELQGDRLEIRANQGHTLKEVDDAELLEPITDPAGITVIHGTYLRHWDAIKSTGLSRMKRNHVHFAPGELGEDGVTSGMRNSAQIYIYVDIEAAMRDGVKFYRSANNVILSPGNRDGFVEPKYFTKVVDLKSKKDLLLE